MSDIDLPCTPQSPNSANKNLEENTVVTPLPVLEFDFVIQPPGAPTPVFVQHKHPHAKLLTTMQHSNFPLSHISNKYIGALNACWNRITD